jgi:purine-binding chemotaxis protein CheW
MSQYSTFRLGDRLFGLDLMMIREINRILDITPVPHAKAHIRGLINLRGQIVTILDLGVRLGLARQDVGEASHNIILKTSSELAAVRHEGNTDPYTTSNDLVGFLVDAIGDVVEADEATIEPPSANVSEAEGGFLSGVIKTDAGLLVLLDINEVLHGE